MRVNGSIIAFFFMLISEVWYNCSSGVNALFGGAAEGKGVGVAVRASSSLTRTWNAKCKMLSPFLLSALQRRLITTPAEAPSLPPSASPPTLTWPEDTVPSPPYSLGDMCMVNMAVWPSLGWLSLFQEESKGKLHRSRAGTW